MDNRLDLIIIKTSLNNFISSNYCFVYLLNNLQYIITFLLFFSSVLYMPFEMTSSIFEFNIILFSFLPLLYYFMVFLNPFIVLISKLSFGYQAVSMFTPLERKYRICVLAYMQQSPAWSRAIMIHTFLNIWILVLQSFLQLY